MFQRNKVITDLIRILKNTTFLSYTNHFQKLTYSYLLIRLIEAKKSLELPCLISTLTDAHIP